MAAGRTGATLVLMAHIENKNPKNQDKHPPASDQSRRDPPGTAEKTAKKQEADRKSKEQDHKPADRKPQDEIEADKAAGLDRVYVEKGDATTAGVPLVAPVRKGAHVLRDGPDNGARPEANPDTGENMTEQQRMARDALTEAERIRLDPSKARTPEQEPAPIADGPKPKAP